MNDVVWSRGDHKEPLGASAVIACPVHEPAVLKAVAYGHDVDSATLREVDEAQACPACRLLLALANSDPAFLGLQPRQVGAVAATEKVVLFPHRASGPARKPDAAPRRRLVVVEDRLAASVDNLCVGPKAPGRYQFDLRPEEADDDRLTTLEVRVGQVASIGVRWLKGFRVRLSGGGPIVGTAFVTLGASPRDKVRHVLRNLLEPAD
jgi:hypothetical protein